MPSLILPNGEQTPVTEWGQGPLLICIHGLGGGAYWFERLGEALKDSHRVVALDLPGSGATPGKQPFSFDRAAEVISQLAEHYSQPATLLGHSMGTIIALKTYARSPEQVKAMIFVGGLPEALPEAKERLKKRAQVIRREGMAASARAMIPFLVCGDFQRREPEQVAEITRRVSENNAEDYARTAEALTEASATDVVPHVKVPCLAITGSDDAYGPPEAVRAFASTFPQETPYHEIATSGHLPFLEHPTTFAHTLASHLK
ncbi:MAG: alpha/beta hydrolase [Acidobacteria bacterium]|nr:alpha/beta hydrolase [Acidobacteriota bacterium]